MGGVGCLLLYSVAQAQSRMELEGSSALAGQQWPSDQGFTLDMGLHTAGSAYLKHCVNAGARV